MTQSNLETVKRAYAAFGRGDVGAVLELMAKDATIGIVGRKEDAPFLGVRTGEGAAAEFFRELGAAHEIHSFEPRRFLAAENEVFVWGHYRWTMRKSGVSKDTEWFHVITLENGKMVKWRGHNDTAMLAEAYHGRKPAAG